MNRLDIEGWIGLDQSKASTRISKEAWQDSLNMRINKEGTAVKRTGFSHVMSSADDNPILDIEQIEIAQNRYELFVTKEAIKRLEGTSSIALIETLNGYDEARFLQWNDKLFMANGIDNIKKLYLKNNNFIFITDSTNHHIYKFDGEGNYIETYGSYGTGDQNLDTPKGIATDNKFIYVCDFGNGKVKKFTFDYTFVAEIALASCTGIAESGGSIYVTASNYIYKYTTSSMAADGSNPSLAVSNLQEVTICADDNFLFYGIIESGPYAAKIIRASLITMVEDTNYDISTDYSDTVSDMDGFATNGTHLIANWSNAVLSAHIHDHAVLTISTMTKYGDIGGTKSEIPSIASDVNIFVYPFIAESPQNDGAGGGGYFDGLWKSDINATDLLKSYTKITCDIAFLCVSQNDFSAWHDLCSPYKPTAYSLGSGSLNDTFYYKTTWGYYDEVTSGITIESSGGLISNAVVANSQYNRIFFDFDLKTQLTKAKADALLITRHVVYRKDGYNDYKFLKSVPVYFELNQSIDSSQTYFEITDAKGYTATGFNMFFKIGDEIILTSTLSGTSFTTCTRGMFDTTAAAHTMGDTIYFYGFADTVASVSSGSVCPVKNDYVENAKYITYNKGSLFIANSNNIWWSSFESGEQDEDVITENNYEPIGKNDGMKITGIFPDGDTIIIFKDGSIYYWSGEVDAYTVNLLSADNGCMAPGSIIPYKKGVFFLGRQGLCYFYSGNIINLSREWIPDTINSINWDYAHTIDGAILKKYNELWLAVPTGSSITPNTIIVLNIDLSNIYKEYNSNGKKAAKCFYLFSQGVTCLKAIVDSNGDEVLYSGTPAGYIDLQDSGNDDAESDINGYFITKDFNSGDFGFRFGWASNFRGIITDYMDEGTHTVEVDYSVDEGSYNDEDFILNSTDLRDISIADIDAEGKQLRIRYRTQLKDEPFEIFGLYLDANIIKLR